MMMVFGMFVFTLRTAPYQQLRHSQDWRHVKNDRINQSAGWQYIGAGDDSITLDGVLYPEITGGNLSLSSLETIGFTGRPWPLIEGDGRIYGMYVMTRLERGKSEFDRYGNPKKSSSPLALAVSTAIFARSCKRRRRVMCSVSCAPAPAGRSTR